MTTQDILVYQSSIDGHDVCTISIDDSGCEEYVCIKVYASELWHIVNYFLSTIEVSALTGVRVSNSDAAEMRCPENQVIQIEVSGPNDDDPGVFRIYHYPDHESDKYYMYSMNHLIFLKLASETLQLMCQGKDSE